MAGLSSLYRNAISRLFSPKYLLITNTVSYGILMGFADCGVQQIEKRIATDKRVKNRSHDWNRTARMFAIGVLGGPICHGWYSLLDRFLPATHRTVVMKKILLDQIIAAPVFALFFFMGAGSLEGQSTERSFTEFKAKFWKVYLFDWSLWPAAQAVNFAYVPSRFRVVYVGFVTLIWDCFMSFIKHEEFDGQHTELEMPVEERCQL